jgi:hypothetical protein
MLSVVYDGRIGVRLVSAASMTQASSSDRKVFDNCGMAG